MAVRRISIPWDRQPHEPTSVNWSDAITLGLEWCAPLSPASGLEEIVSGRRGTPTGLGTSAVARNGLYHLFGASNYADFEPRPSNIGASTPCTFAWTQEPRSGSGYSTILNWKPEGATYPFLIYQSVISSIYYFSVGPRNGLLVPSFGATVGIPTNGVLDKYVLQCLAGTSSVTATDYVLWRNGTRIAAGSGSGGYGINTTDSMRIGALESGSDAFEGLLGNFHIWSRVLRDEEAQRWCENEFCTLEPQQIWVPSATVAADQAEAATAAEVQAALVAWQVAIAEAAAATDAQTATAALAGALTEAATAADAITVTVINAASLTEAATAADVQTSVATLLAAIAEAATAAESTTTGGVTTADLTESVTAADALAALAPLAAALTEPATAADLLAAAMVANAAVSEALAAADLLAAGPQLSGAVDETATAADALAVTASLVAQIAEAATPDDAATVAQQLLALITDSATAADLVDGDMPSAYSVTLSEVAAAVDLIAASLSGDITSRYIVRAAPISRVVAGRSGTRIVRPA